MSSRVGLIVGLLIGCLAAIVVALTGFWALRTSWPAYAAAEPIKAYTLAMLVSRLMLGALSTAVAACVATKIAVASRRVPWLVGAIILAIRIPDHLYPGYVWNDYPAWYHVAYLSYLVPVAGLAGRLSRAWSGTEGLREPPDGQRVEPTAVRLCGLIRATGRRG